MEEIIVIKDKEVSKVCEECGDFREGCIMIENCKHKDTLSQTECCFNFRFTPKFEVEKYPTNWEELKELCKELEAKGLNIVIGEITIAVKIPHFKSYVRFREDGVIFADEDFTAIAENRSLQQMWNIIKNLVEE